jgi:methane/ammonia monooxygenase subunit C
MSAVLKPDSIARTAETGAKSSPKHLIKLGPVAMVWGLLLAIYVGLRVFQQEFAFKYGLDSTTPEFAAYWVTLFKVEVPLIFSVGIVIWAYLWMTRDKNLDKIDAETELRRYFGMVAWFLCYTFSFVFIASFFGEGDATWHQTVIRDTALTPSHIVVFYACIPLYIVFGVGSLLYAMTRVPRYAKGYSVPLIMAVLGPGLILPNLGYNEWGHAFWLTEEIFSHPLHWGFPVLGWTGLALGGVLVQVVSRMSELFVQIGTSDKLKKA